MVRCWWLIRPVAHRVRHAAHGIGRSIRHHKAAAVVATLVCTVTAAPLGYGIGSRIWENWGQRDGVTVEGAVDHANGAEPSRDTSSASQTQAVNGGVTGGESAAINVPEPSSLALFAAALVPLIVIRRVLR